MLWLLLVRFDTYSRPRLQVYQDESLGLAVHRIVGNVVLGQAVAHHQASSEPGQWLLLRPPSTPLPIFPPAPPLLPSFSNPPPTISFSGDS